MTDQSLPPIPCPLCDSCDHDLRANVLDLIENLGQNIKSAGEQLLDAMEAQDAGIEEFAEAMVQFHSLGHQMAAVIEAIPDIARIKAAHVQ